MFGISFAKVLLLVAVVAIVWYGFKYLQTISAAGNGPAPAAPKRKAPGAASEPTQVTAEDMVACRVCGTYVPAKGAKPCARADCIFRR